MNWIIFLALIVSPGHIKMLYNGLDPTSIHEHLALWELYPDSPEGARALHDVQRLLATEALTPLIVNNDFKKVLEGMVALINKSDQEELPLLDESTLRFVDTVARDLPNRKLKGHTVTTEAEVMALSNDEIDLSRGLFLSEMGPENFQKIRSYEALLDLMALQIKARLSIFPSDEEKVTLINRYIFDELGYRFPPHSSYSQDIDLYTFLPSVMDSRRGVCLGVSILYIALAQRLDLALEMVTPPGHIYVRVGDINIETTARGVNLDSSIYLGVDTRSLEVRTIREVIGMAHFNQAAVYWRKNDPLKALACYRRAEPYMKEDKLLTELMAYNFILSDQEEEGRRYLNKVKDHLPDHAVSKNSVPIDYLSGKADKEALQAIYKEVDEKRASIITKKNLIEAALKRCPEFKGGWFSLAISYLQLHRMKEALTALEKVHQLDPNDATAEYYLAALYSERENFQAAWFHLRQAEKLTKERNHEPKALIELRRELSLVCPE